MATGLVRAMIDMSREIRHLNHVVHAFESLQADGINALAPVFEAAGKEMVEYSKGMLGHYDHEETTWPQLSPITQADRERLGFPANEPLLRTGDLRDSYSFDVVASPSVIFLIVGSDDVRSIFNELGTSEMPPRPVLAPTAMAYEERMAELLGDEYEKALFVKLDGAFARLISR